MLIKKKLFAALLMMLALSSCDSMRGHFKADKDTLAALAPDVPGYSRPLQSQAAQEAVSGQCVAETYLLVGCMTTRDQARLLAPEPPPSRWPQNGPFWHKP